MIEKEQPEKEDEVVEPVAVAAGLDGLFESDEVVEPVAVAAGLDDLFESDEVVEPVAVAAGLDDLFESDEVVEPVAVAAEDVATGGSGALELPSDKKRPHSRRKPQTKQTKSPRAQTEENKPDRPAPFVFFKASSGEEPRDSMASIAPQKSRPSGTGGRGVLSSEEPTYSESATKEQREKWRARMERLWPSVEQLLRIAGSAPSLDPIRARMSLTQDPDADTAQREELVAALRPEVAVVGANDLFRSREDVAPVTSFFYDEMLGISVLGDLWRDPDVTEIMVDGWDRIVVEKAGKLHLTERSFINAEHASSIARSLALRVSDRAVSNSIPLVSAELPNARVSIAYGPVVKSGLAITIRKFRNIMELKDLLEVGAVDSEMVEFLAAAVRARAGILVSGGTGSGKTTIINLLSAFVPDNERVITIEDAFELNLSNTHVVSLQTKEQASADDTVSVTLADLLRNTLRMRPDRIVVGEIREPDAAEVMLAAANTGHAGTMTTIHANTPEAALNERLHDLLLQRRPGNEDSIRRTIASAFDLVVQVRRSKDGSRYVSEIAVVDPLPAEYGVRTHPLFTGHGDRLERSFLAHLPSEKRARDRVSELVGPEIWEGWDG